MTVITAMARCRWITGMPTRGSGVMVRCMVRVLTPVPMVHSTRGSSVMVWQFDSDDIHGAGKYTHAATGVVERIETNREKNIRWPDRE